MARYICLTTTFIAPHRMVEGQTFTVDKSWTPGPHVEAANNPRTGEADAETEEAQACLDEYYRTNPFASLNPIEALPNHGVRLEEAPTPKAEDLNLSLAQAEGSKASPGATESGRIPGDKERLVLEPPAPEGEVDDTIDPATPKDGPIVRPSPPPAKTK